MRQLNANYLVFAFHILMYLKGNVLPMSRLACVFLDYLISNTSLTDADVPKNIKLDEIRELTSMVSVYLLISAAVHCR